MKPFYFNRWLYVVDYGKLLQWLAKANGEQDSEQDSTAPAPVYSFLRQCREWPFP